ncbi:hypothetical protein JCM10207_001921 [Rhodosporidiobolus poonsookiae]
MPLPNLNADVFAVIVQQVVALAAASGDSPTSRFSLRSATLRQLCLVNSLWRSVAQPQLDREVFVTPWNYEEVWEAFKWRDEARRRVVRRLEAVGNGRCRRGIFELEPLGPLVELFDQLEDLHCEAWSLSLSVWAGMKHLRSFTLLDAALDGSDATVQPSCRLSRLSLSIDDFPPFNTAAFAALARAGTGTLLHLQLGYFSTDQGALLYSALPSLLSSLRTLDLDDYSGETTQDPSGRHVDPTLLAHLGLCSSLERLVVSIPQVRFALGYLPTPPPSRATPRPGIFHLSGVVEVLVAGRLGQLDELQLYQLSARWSNEVEELSRAPLGRLRQLADERGFRVVLL